MVDTHPVLTPFKAGTLELPNRVCMGAMTRQRADYATNVPNDLHVEYYSSRASAGLIFTEGTASSFEGNAFPGCANCLTDEQIEGWKKVV